MKSSTPLTGPFPSPKFSFQSKDSEQVVGSKAGCQEGGPALCSEASDKLSGLSESRSPEL